MAGDLVTPSTELEAVNAMLAIIGESAINTIDDAQPLPPDAEMALFLLRLVAREVQSLGWFFNTEIEYPLTRAGDGTITCPANTLRCAVKKRYQSKNVTTRGLKLYDRDNHTFVFTDDIKVELVLLLSWDDLPEAARNYIYIRAARRFQASALGSQQLASFTDVDESVARSLLMESETDTAGYNILTDSEDMLQIVSRSYGVSDPVRLLGDG
jgi:hypothetical protein